LLEVLELFRSFKKLTKFVIITEMQNKKVLIKLLKVNSKLNLTLMNLRETCYTEMYYN